MSAEDIAGLGRYPQDPDYISQFIALNARKSEGWAIAWALLQVAKSLEIAGRQIGGVDHLTGIQGVGNSLEWIAREYAEKNKSGNGGGG
jgi:hypothetical protein